MSKSNRKPTQTWEHPMSGNVKNVEFSIDSNGNARLLLPEASLTRAEAAGLLAFLLDLEDEFTETI